MDMHSQKYNPEVPMESSTSDNNSELHKINDQLITMKNIVNKQVIFLYFVATTQNSQSPSLPLSLSCQMDQLILNVNLSPFLHSHGTI